MDSLNYLKDLVKIKSYDTKTSNKQITEYITNIFKLNNIPYQLLCNPDGILSSIVAGINNNLNNINDAIILSGHIDTVAPNNLWDTDPNTIKIDGDIAYGLGIIDMKAFTSTILNNIDNLKKLQKPIIIALSCDEETDMYGIKEIVKYFKQNNINGKYAIIGEPSNSCPVVGSKGFFESEITITGKSCHSSMPFNGTNAIYIASKIVAKLEELSLQIGKDTLNVGIINGGTVCNIVPDKCTIRYEIRTFSTKTLDFINNQLNKLFIDLEKNHIGCTINCNLVFSIPPFQEKIDDTTNKIIEYLQQPTSIYGASTEAGYFQELGMGAIILGVGDLKYAHKPNEQMSISEYNEYQNKFLEILKIL